VPESHKHLERRAEFRRFALFLICFFAVWSLTVFFLWRPSWYVGKLDSWLQSAVKAALWLGLAFVAARLAGAKQPLRWMGFHPIGFSAIAAAVVVVAALLSKDLARVILLEGRGPNWGSFATHLAGAGLTGMIEETLFSGAILTWLARYLGPARSVLINSTLFFLIHVPGWLILQIPVTTEKIAAVTVISLVCGILRQATGSLWPAVAAHGANNAGVWF
jgi:membrane protease YdiL (CAAX protease family)